MKAQRVIPRALANQDVEDAIDDDLAQQAGQAASGFIDDLQAAYAQIARHPASGLSRSPMSSICQGFSTGH